MISVFGGTGFIGSRFLELYPENRIVGRDEFTAPTNKILYLISTVDNYNMFEQPYLDIDTNLKELVARLEQNRRVYGKDFEFNFVSSFFVYGNNALPFREDMLCNPMGFYSITKFAAERMVETYCRTYNIPYRIIRLANVYGKGDKFSKRKNAFQYLLEKVKKDEEIPLYDGGHFYRDMIYIDDVCKGLNFIVEQGGLNEIVNLGTGIPQSFHQIFHNVIWKTGSKSKIISVEIPEFHKIVGIGSAVLDITKLESWGFSPETEIDDGIMKLLE